ncbi:MAG: TIM barrel protein [Planctomycetota bacterium]
MKLSVCLELFFTDVPLEERIAKVKAAGFSAGEFWGHDGKNLEAIAAACREDRFEIVAMTAFGIHPGLNDPAVHDELIRQLEKSIEAAMVVRCRRLIVLAGNTLKKVTRWAQARAIVAGLRRMAPIADRAGFELVLENLNTSHDHVGYYLDRTEEMAMIVRAVDHPRVKALFDIYHAGVMEGNLTQKISDQIDTIGHFHLAGIPGRHEPKDGEINYPALAKAVDAAGYSAYAGLEYIPLKDHLASLVETREWILGGT